MAKIAYILLCHKDPEAIIQQAERLTAAGDCMSIHFDGRAPAEAFGEIRAALQDNPNVTFARKRVKCGWGEWSLVEATLLALEAAEQAFPRATHFYMLSGDCMAIKTAEYAHRFLDARDCDFIESFDFFESDWIKTGMKEERLIYRHFFNERSHKKLFYAAVDLQKKLGLKRKIPEDIRVQIGSQWWCLRRRTVEWILDFTRKRREVLRFLAPTWIPDETSFQTLRRHPVPEAEIDTRTLTFLMFTDYGMPVNFHNDHFDLLLSQDFLFARKISPGAKELKSRLGRLYAARGVDFQISNEGRSLYQFLAGRGRIGQRFAPRFWETESSLGRERELLIVVCKKWHVAKRLLDQIRKISNIHRIPVQRGQLPAARPRRHSIHSGKTPPPPPRPDADAVRLLQERPADRLHGPRQYRAAAGFCLGPLHHPHLAAGLPVLRRLPDRPRPPRRAGWRTHPAADFGAPAARHPQ